MESVPYDVEQYLKRLGPDAALKTFAEFAEATKADDAFAPGGALHYMTYQRQFAACLANPSVPPDLSDFVAAREAYLEIFTAVFAAQTLDGLCFPQMRTDLAGLHSGGRIDETTVSEINIAGIPGVTVPAGFYASGAPFNLIFVGPKWSEAEILALAYAYEQATHHRKAPILL
jgi:aspartyl-tRNA(Asn)/glutamyl-tRNA(Gln) amidotransferase subunit A